MSFRYCSSCNKSYEPDATFCSSCGNRLSPPASQCRNCAHINPAENHQCAKCGKSLADPAPAILPATTATTAPQIQAKALNSIQTQMTAAPEERPDFGEITAPAQKTSHLGSILGNNKGLLALLSVILLTASLGSYYYFSYSNDSRYIKTVLSTAANIVAIDKDIINEVDDAIIRKSLGSIKDSVRQKKDYATAISSQIQQESAPDKYKNFHQTLSEVAKHQVQYLDTLLLIIENPFANEYEDHMKNLLSVLEEKKKLTIATTDIETALTRTSSPPSFPGNLKSYLNEQRMIRSGKKEKLDANLFYFNQFDVMMQKYSATLKNWEEMLEKIGTPGYNYTWKDYFQTIDEAIAARKTLRNDIRSLPKFTYPEGDSLKSAFADIVTSSLSYCETMRAIGKTASTTKNSSSLSAKKKNASEANKKIEAQLIEFTQDYEAAKARLTKIENL